MVSCCEAPLSCGGGINSRRGWCQAAWKEEQAEEELGEEEEKAELLVGRKQQEAEAGMEEKAAVGEEVQPPRHPGARRQDRVYVERLWIDLRLVVLREGGAPVVAAEAGHHTARRRSLYLSEAE